jgi:hypothetical protein
MHIKLNAIEVIPFVIPSDAVTLKILMGVPDRGRSDSFALLPLTHPPIARLSGVWLRLTRSLRAEVYLSTYTYFH